MLKERIMCKEISPWNFIINALYYVKDKEPLSLNPQDKKYFWKFTFISSKFLKKDFENICLYFDRYDLENVLWNNNLYIEIKDDKLQIDNSIDEKYIRQINEYLNQDIRKRLPEIFNKAYRAL